MSGVSDSTPGHPERGIVERIDEVLEGTTPGQYRTDRREGMSACNKDIGGALRCTLQLGHDGTHRWENPEIDQSKYRPASADAPVSAQPESHMLKVNGVPFRCDCKTNVFGMNELGNYVCNGCGAEYEPTPLVSGERERLYEVQIERTTTLHIWADDPDAALHAAYEIDNTAISRSDEEVSEVSTCDEVTEDMALNVDRTWRQSEPMGEWSAVSS